MPPPPAGSFAPHESGDTVEVVMQELQWWQKPGAVSGLAAFAAVLLLIALWQALTFHLNKRTHKIFVDEIERLKANGLQQDVTPEARHVVEDLTGYRYDTLWGDTPPERVKAGEPTSVLN